MGDEQALTFAEFQRHVATLCERARALYAGAAPEVMSFADWWELVDLHAAEVRIGAVDLRTDALRECGNRAPEAA